MNNDDGGCNNGCDTGAANAERAKEKADKHPTKTPKTDENEVESVDRSKIAKEEALAEANASRQGPSRP